MKAKPQIKIIKRSEQPQQKSVVKIKPKTTQSTAREMVATVTEWVNEFQQKRREETQETINKFFSQSPATTGCSN